MFYFDIEQEVSHNFLHPLAEVDIVRSAHIPGMDDRSLIRAGYIRNFYNTNLRQSVQVACWVELPARRKWNARPAHL